MYVSEHGYAETQPVKPEFTFVSTLAFSNHPAFNLSTTTCGYPETHMSVPDCDVREARERLANTSAYRAKIFSLFQARFGS